jgi:Transposase DDE domain
MNDPSRTTEIVLGFLSQSDTKSQPCRCACGVMPVWGRAPRPSRRSESAARLAINSVSLGNRVLPIRNRHIRIRVRLYSLRKKWLGGIRFRTSDAQGKLIRGRNARKRRATGSGVQLRVLGHVRHSLVRSQRDPPGSVTGFVQSQQKRKRVEQVFGWIKHVAGMRQTKFRGRRRVEWMFQLAAAALNLRRLQRLLPQAA